MGENFYDVLQVPASATQRDLKMAYRRLAQTYHPDVNSNVKDSEHIKIINLAYETLSNPSKRARYDQSLLGNYFEPQQTSYTPPRPPRRPPPYYYHATAQSSQPNYSFRTQILAWGATVVIILAAIIAVYTMQYYASEYYFNQGMEAEQANNLESAIHLYQEAVRDFGSKNVEASIKSAELSQKIGAFYYMVEFCEKGLRYDPDTLQKATLLFLEGTAYEKTERYKKAETAYLKSLDYNFRKDTLYQILGSMYINHMAKYEKAEELYTFLLSGNTINLANYYNRGICYQYLGEHQKAIDDFQKVLANNPYHGQTLFQLGRSYLALGNKEIACEYLRFSERQGVDIDPEELAKACD